MKLLRITTIALLLACTRAGAQQAATAAPPPQVLPGSYVVKTVPLHHLSSQEAVKLLSPYVRSMNGGVFEVSPNIRAVTIREIPAVYADMIAVLGQFDRETAGVTLNFQLVAAENTGTRDPGVASLDSLLRGVLKFTGYRLLSTSVATASESGRVTQSLAADGEPYSLQVFVSDLRIDGNDASVHLDVELWRTQVAGSAPISSPKVLSTGVTVPLGQTVVLGTSASDGGKRALILTVRPALAPSPKR
jgi:hypothetical protein